MFLLAAVVVVNDHGFAPKKKKKLEPRWRFEAQWQKKTRFIFFTLVSPGVRSLLDFSFLPHPHVRFRLYSYSLPECLHACIGVCLVKKVVAWLSNFRWLQALEIVAAW
jgi:hypothetical protein